MMFSDPITGMAILAAILTAAVVGIAEGLHARRVSRLGRLAFGPAGTPRRWTKIVPLLRVAAMAGMVWSFITLLAYHHLSRDRDRKKQATRHLMVMLDVSPSMRLADAGETRDKPRSVRAAELLASVLNRVPGDHVRFSAASFYTEARLLARECQDRELMVHFAADVPFFYTYQPGKTDLLKSLNQTGAFMKDWPRKSTTLLVLTDGDSVAPTGLEPMPSAVSEVLFVGVGDPSGGTFIDGHLSRQDSTTLTQLARRLGGKYFDGNSRHLPSDALRAVNASDAGRGQWRNDRRMLALIVLAAASSVLCVTPVLLDMFGSAWRPSAAPPRDSSKPSPSRSAA